MVHGLWDDEPAFEPASEPASEPAPAASVKKQRQAKKHKTPSSPAAPASAPEPDEEVDAAPPPSATALNTLGDAYEHCHSLVERQLDKAVREHAATNMAIPGDLSVRAAILLLLPEDFQRRLFLQTARTPATWPRLRPLFGAPPYHFLRPEDGGALRAGGFAKARVQMVYQVPGMVPSVSQFAAQYVDEYDRSYRIKMAKPHTESQMPGPGTLEQHSVLFVKVQRRSREKIKDATGSREKCKPYVLPRPGETLALKETTRLLSARKLRATTTTVVKVLGCVPREGGGAAASTGMLRYIIT